MMALKLEPETLSNGLVIGVLRIKAHVPAADFEHDPRAMNHMDDDTKVMHARLLDWAKHAKRILGALGFPSESYYHKWAALKIAPNPGFDAEMPQRAFNVDQAITRLCEIDRSVIWRYYCQFRPVDIWTRLRGISSKGEFDKVLKRARHRIEGILMEIEKNI